MKQSSVQMSTLLILLAAIPSLLYADEPPSRSSHTTVVDGDIEPLEEAKHGWLFERIARREKVPAAVLHRALRAGQMTLRADAARMLGDWGDAGSIPHLIHALTDESSYVGARPKDPGMLTVRYWANQSLVKLTGRDFGFAWDDALDKRNAAVLRWTTWYLTLKPNAAEPGQKAGADQKQADRIAWVNRCLKDFQAIKMGMSRNDVEQRLDLEFGVQGNPVRFTHPECPYFKLELTFSADGTVKKVAKPYLDWAIID